MNQRSIGVMAEKVRPKLKPPAMYKVIMLNDDYTPMDFVVIVLEMFFALSPELACQVMLDVHQKGKGVCGVFTKDIAETKVAQVTDCARQNDYPLLCEIQKL